MENKELKANIKEKKKMKKLFSIALTIIMLVALIPQGVIAAGTNQPPKVTGISIVNPEVQKPGVLYVDVEFTESGIGLEEIMIWVMELTADGKINQSYNFASHYKPEGIDAYSGTTRVPVIVPSNIRDGKYVVYRVQLSDNLKNVTFVDALMAGQDAAWKLPGYEGKLAYYLHGNYDGSEWTPAFMPNGEPLPVTEFTIHDEFDLDFEIGLSNPQLVSKLNNMPEGKAGKILIDNSSKGIFPKAAFDAIKGKDKTVVLYKEGYQWIFNGKDITKATKDVNLNLTVGQESGEAYGVSEKIVSVTFQPNGELPGKATIRLKSDYLYNQQGITGKLYLYYVNGDNLQEEQGNFNLVMDGTDKWCHFNVTHNSKFVISNQKLSKSNNNNNSTKAYTITYHKNGATGGKVPKATVGNIKNNKVIVSKNSGKLVRKGFVFAGWNTKANGTGKNYKLGTSTTVGKNGLVLYAKWNKAKITTSGSSVKRNGKLTLTVKRDKGDNIKSVKWTTSKSSTVSIKVSGNGNVKCTVTGKKKGNVDIKAVITFKDGSKQTLTRKIKVT